MKKPLLSITNVIKALVLLVSLVCTAIPVSVLVADFQRLQSIHTQQPSRTSEPPPLAQMPIENVPPTSSQDRIQSLAAVPPLEQRLKNKISVEFRRTGIEDVLRILGDMVNVHIVKPPDVTGEVSIIFVDVPLEEALNKILSVLGYTYKVTGGIIQVTTSEKLPGGYHTASSLPGASPPDVYTAGAVKAIVNSDRPCALIENRIVHEGDTINGIKVVKIEKGRVHFEKNGKRWTQGVWYIKEAYTKQPTLPQGPMPVGQIARESVLREIDRMWNQEYEMIKRWWSIEEEQAKSLPTVWLREYHDRQALENFQQRDRELKGRYSTMKKEAASLPERVDASFLQELWRSQEQQMQARATQWEQSRKQELDQIWASYEQQRKHDALVWQMEQVRRQVEMGQKELERDLRDLEMQVQLLEGQIRSR